MSTQTPLQKGPVIVTGGSRGIGKATCLVLASRGYDVVVNCRSNVDAANALRDAIEKNQNNDVGKKGGRALVVQADVSKEDEVKRLFDETEAYFGQQPTGLVNNAGILGKVTQDLTELSKNDLDEVFATNVYGPFYCCKEFIQRTSILRDGQGGAIVNVSSGSAYIGRPLVYAMSKGALDSLMAGLAQKLPEDGIRINAVAPGVTETDMVAQFSMEKVTPTIPMKRAGKPSEIAETIYFLLSEASSYCSGAKIRAAGGRP